MQSLYALLIFGDEKIIVQNYLMDVQSMVSTMETVEQSTKRICGVWVFLNFFIKG